jgi:putative aldouronate transport system substrate-binding protein
MLANSRMGPKICLILVLTLVIAIVSGCTEETTKTPTTSPTPAQTEPEMSAPGTLPIVKEKVEFTIMRGANTAVTDYKSNWFTLFLEDRTNIRINWEIVSEIDTSMNLALASNDLPDAFMGVDMSDLNQVIYGEDGTFVDLSEMIDKYGYWTKQMFDYDETVRPTITLPSGKIVSLPRFEIGITTHMSAPMKGWINLDWLKAVGKEKPNTVDELRDVLTAFRDKDPNGNNLKDEIPITGRGFAFHNFLNYIVNAFIVMDRVNYFVQPYDGNNIKMAYAQDEFRNALVYMNSLYNEGLIDPECFTQDRELLKTKIRNDKSGMTFSYAVSAFVDTTSDDVFAKWDNVPPLVGVTSGKRQTTFSPAAGVITGRFTITKACKNPELLFRWADAIYDPEIELNNLYGMEDVNWRKATADEIGINGKPAVWTRLNTGFPQNSSWQWDFHFSTAESYYGESYNESTYNIYAGQEAKLYFVTIDNYLPYTTRDVIGKIYDNPATASERSDLQTALNTYWQESTAAFITGVKSLDKWDEYLAELEKIGLSRYIELTQDNLKK